MAEKHIISYWTVVFLDALAIVIADEATFAVTSRISTTGGIAAAERDVVDLPGASSIAARWTALQPALVVRTEMALKFGLVRGV